jgi:hypothetical protein
MYFAVMFVIVTVPALVLLWIAITLRVTGRALPKPRVVEYLPPKGVPVLDAALLSGNDNRGIAAALIGMAIDRKIRILAEPDRKAPVAVELQPNAAFTAQELAILDALFGAGHTSSRVRRFSRDKRAQSRQIQRVLAIAEANLVSFGLIGRRVTWRTGLLRICAGVAVIGAVFFAVGSGENGETPAMWLCLASAALALTALFIAPGSWRRYEPPSELIREQLAGLNGYITLAEADRLKFLQSPSGALRAASGLTSAGLAVGVPATADPALGFELDRLILNERLLPYAILFGHSKEWLAELKVSYANLDHAHIENLGVAMDVAGDLLLLASVLGDVTELVFALGDAVDAGGVVLDVVGAGAGALADLLDGF